MTWVGKKSMQRCFNCYVHWMHQHARNFRPFSLRLARIFRPPTERSRARNPCLFFRLRQWGWYVRFVLPFIQHACSRPVQPSSCCKPPTGGTRWSSVSGSVSAPRSPHSLSCLGFPKARSNAPQGLLSAEFAPTSSVWARPSRCPKASASAAATPRSLGSRGSSGSLSAPRHQPVGAANHGSPRQPRTEACGRRQPGACSVGTPSKRRADWLLPAHRSDAMSMCGPGPQDAAGRGSQASVAACG